MEFKTKDEVLEYFQMTLLKFEIGELSAAKMNAATKACEFLVKQLDNNDYWSF